MYEIANPNLLITLFVCQQSYLLQILSLVGKIKEGALCEILRVELPGPLSLCSYVFCQLLLCFCQVL